MILNKSYLGNNEVTKIYLGVTLLYGEDGAPNGNFTFTVPEGGASTSAGVYQVIEGDDILVRTLWSGKQLSQGIHTAHWDGLLDDAETIVPYEGYKIKVLTSNASYEWEGSHIGNSGTAISGTEVLRAGETIRGLAQGGSYLFVAGSNNEAVSPRIRFNSTTNPTKSHYMEAFSAHEQALDQVCTDSENVYWGGYWIGDNAIDTSEPHNTMHSAVTVNKIADDSDVVFTNGIPYKTGYSRYYPSTIGHKVTTFPPDQNDALHRDIGLITGIAVQQSGNYLFVSRGNAVNELIVIDKRTTHGEVVQTYTDKNHPTWMAIGADDSLWAKVDGNIVKKFSVNSSTGALTEVMSITIDADTTKHTGCIKVSPDGTKLAVCHLDDQVVKFYNTSTGAYINSLGDGTSYQTDSSVNNYKFYWKDDTQTHQAFLCYLNDGTLWVGDPINRRMLRYDTSNVFINACYVPTMNYFCMALPNAPQRVFSESLEYEVDYSVPMTNTTGWTLKKNWGAKLIQSFYDGLVRNITQLPSGKTFGTIRGRGEYVVKSHLIELVEGGTVRDTGIIFDTRQFMLPNGDKVFNPEGAAIGIQSHFYRYPYLGMGSDGNPIWGSEETYCTTPVLSYNDPIPAQNLVDNITTQSGNVIFFNSDPDPYFNSTPNHNFHLGAIKVGDDKWLWKTARGTSNAYNGEFPLDGGFDLGNTVIYAGGRVCIHENHVFWNYHGEFYKQSQTSKINHVDGNTGLFIGQFGIVGADFYGEFLPAEFAGNTYHICVVEVNGIAYMYVNNESGGIQRWILHNLDSVQVSEAIFPTSATLSNEFAVKGIDLMEGITWDMSTLPLSYNGWTKTLANQETDIGFVRNFIGPYTYDPFQHPDVFMWVNHPTPFILTRTIPNSITLNSWAINSRINFTYNTNSDGNTGTHSWYLAILDDQDKIITHFTNSYYGAVSYYFNNQIIFNLKDYDTLERNKYRQTQGYLKPFNVTCVNGTFYLDWAGHTFTTDVLYDNTANWHKPSKFQWVASNNSNNVVSHSISIDSLRFIDNAIAPVFPAPDTSKIIFTDNFTTNGNLVGYNGWTSISGTPNATITNGVVSLGTNDAKYIFNNSVLNSLTNYDIEFKIVIGGGGSVVRFLFGYVDELNYYSVYMYKDGGSSFTAFASKVVNGVETALYDNDSSSATIKNFNSPFVDFKVHVSDTEFRVTLNEATQKTTLLSTPMTNVTGKIGFHNIVAPISIKELKISHL